MNDRSEEVRPLVLTIAGSDSGGGAGIQADLLALRALGCYGASAITCVTAQNLDEVARVDALPPEAVQAQIETVARGFRVHAVKTGMLYSREIVETVVECYDRLLAPVPLVVDPVMVAESGARLLQDDAVEAYGELFERASVITPNVDELAVLAGARPEDLESLERVARRLVERWGTAVLAKGGHLDGPAVDLLVTPEAVRRFEAERVEDVVAHGSGCRLASAVAAGLAYDQPLEDAVTAAKRWMEASFSAAVVVETPEGSVRILGVQL